MEKTRQERNLARTLDLIDLCFTLKEAYLRQRHSGASSEEIRRLIYRGTLERKEKQWKSQKSCSKP